MILGCDLHTRYQQVAMLDTDTGELDGWPILNFAFFAKFRVGMLEAGPQPATDCEEARDRVEMG